MKMKNYIHTMMEFIGVTVLVLLLLLFKNRMHIDHSLWVSVLSINFLYLVIKIILALGYSFKESLPASEDERILRVAAVIPFYNEDPASLLQVLTCLKKQTYPVAQMIFVDDGSISTAAYEALISAVAVSESTADIKVLRLAENRGKKQAQVAAFDQLDSELTLLLDSDGDISVDTIAVMVEKFRSPKVGAVVGKIVPRNSRENLLTKMQGLIYSSSFQLGRRAQSVVGSVVVCSGALSMYRSEIIKKNLDLFQSEDFLGIPCTTGDDRLLTFITLKTGYQTLYLEAAVCRTDVPRNLKQFFKQQVRWHKSALILTVYTLPYLWKRPATLFFGVMESYLWLINLLVMATALFNQEGLFFDSTTILWGSGYLILAYYLSTIFYARGNFLGYLLGVPLNLFYSVLLIAIRAYAILTLGKSKWATR